MFADTYRQFRAMRPSVRSLVYLFWIYSFTSGMIGVFTQVFLYQTFTSVELNVIATIAQYTGIMVGFTLPGILASLWRLNIKQGFAWSFLFLGLSIFYLLFIDSTREAYLAMFLLGFGQGVFWLTINTFELSETVDEERDFYSSAVNAGTQVLGLAGPATATALVVFSDTVLGIGTYTLLFAVTPAIFLLGFFCFASIRDYRPPRIRMADVVHFFSDKHNQAAQLYTFGTGLQHMLDVVIPPLVVLLILGSAFGVGLYSTLFALFSAACVLLVARYRTQRNRVFIFAVTAMGIAFMTALMGYSLTFPVLIAYTLVIGLLSPALNVTSHVIDLAVMETGRSDTDFYATMILRDVFLWLWRALSGVSFLLLITALETEKAVLTFGLYFLAVSYLIKLAGAHLFVRLAPSPHRP